MHTVELNKAELSAITKIEKASLEYDAIQLESTIIKVFLNSVFRHLPSVHLKTLQGVSNSRRFFTAHKEIIKGVLKKETSLLREMFALTAKDLSLNDPLSISTDVVTDIRNRGELSFDVLVKNSKIINNSPKVLIKYLKRINVACMNEGIPISLCMEKMVPLAGTDYSLIDDRYDIMLAKSEYIKVTIKVLNFVHQGSDTISSRKDAYGLFSDTTAGPIEYTAHEYDTKTKRIFLYIDDMKKILKSFNRFSGI